MDTLRGGGRYNYRPYAPEGRAVVGRSSDGGSHAGSGAVPAAYRHGKMAESKKLALAIRQLKADDLVAQFDIPELLAIFKSA